MLRHTDEAAGIAAVRRCGGRVVTAGVDRMTFPEPVHIGDVLTFKATVNAVWRTSLEVESAEGRGREGEAQLRRANRLAQREQIVQARDA